MKRLMPLLLFAVFVITTAHTPPLTFKKFKAPKGYVYVPSGNLSVNGTDISVMGFFIADHEVTNKEYNSFLADLKKQNRLDDYEKAKPKTEKWESYAPPLVEVYHSHKAYSEYPVVNISKEAAQMYCNWLNEKFKNHKNFHVNFRLPQEVEWVHAAKGGNDEALYGWGTTTVEDKKGQRLGNFKYGENVYFFSSPAKSYTPNDYGIYNMSGNVAEFTATTGSVKGGSWNDDLSALEVLATQNNETLSPAIGFRPVLTIVSK